MFILNKALITLLLVVAIFYPVPAKASGSSIPEWALIIIFPLAVIANLLDGESIQDAREEQSEMPASGEN